jgi:hypothetical protein
MIALIAKFWKTALIPAPEPLPNEVDVKTIKAHYRRAALRLHPDKMGAEYTERFSAMQNAYEDLLFAMTDVDNENLTSNDPTPAEWSGLTDILKQFHRNNPHIPTNINETLVYMDNLLVMFCVGSYNFTFNSPKGVKALSYYGAIRINRNKVNVHKQYLRTAYYYDDDVVITDPGNKVYAIMVIMLIMIGKLPNFKKHVIYHMYKNEKISDYIEAILGVREIAALDIPLSLKSSLETVSVLIDKISTTLLMPQLNDHQWPSNYTLPQDVYNLPDTSVLKHLGAPFLLITDIWEQLLKIKKASMLLNNNSQQTQSSPANNIPPPPPVVWKQLWSSEHNNYYYWNRHTGHVTWDAPTVPFIKA